MSSEPKSKKKAKRESTKTKEDKPKALGLFDHVKHIRTVQDPNYFDNLSEEDRKSFNHFMLLRALSMDENALEMMAELYRYFDKIPSPQFYKLLIAVTPKTHRWVPWVKARFLRHNKDLVNLIADHFEEPRIHANQYINLLIQTDEGLEELVSICRKYGMSDKEVEDIINKDDYEK